MKKFISFILIFVCCFIFIGCDNNIGNAVKFNQSTIDNEFNNGFINDYPPNMAYFDKSLYFQHQSNLKYRGTWQLNNDGLTKIDGKKDVSLIERNVSFYTFNGVAYERIQDNGSPIWYRYNNEEKCFKKIGQKCKVAQLAYENLDAFSKLPDDNNKLINLDKLVYFGDSFYVTTSDDGYRLNVHYYKNMNYSDFSYSNLKDYQIEWEIDNYYIYGEMIYFFHNGTFYVNDISKGNEESDSLTDLNIEGANVLFYCDGEIYYSVEEDNKEVLCCYSIVDNTNKCVLNKNFNCLNGVYNQENLDNQLFAAVEDGVYRIQGSDATKISDIKTESIYIFDKKWVYLNNNDGEIFRITHDGNTVERISVL